jgi:hypothetical protein
MTSIGVLSLRIPVRHPTLIGLELPLAPLIGITKKRKKIITCTQEIIRVKLEQLRSTRLIHRDQTIMTRHTNDLIKTNELINQLARTLRTISMILAIVS